MKQYGQFETWAPAPRRRNITPRELACLRALVVTGSNGEAARSLGISESTVKNHLMHLHQKLNLTTYQLIWAFAEEIEAGA